MKRMNVRCCCNPAVLIGSLPVEDHVGDGQRLRMCLMKPFPSCVEDMKDDNFAVAELEVAAVYNGRGEVLDIAIKSNDRPIEFWRSIPGFNEYR